MSMSIENKAGPPPPLTSPCDLTRNEVDDNLDDNSVGFVNIELYI